jgi:NDP-sugar pyrophosphorylase family protein
MREFHDRKMSDLTVGFKKHDHISPFGVLKFDGEKIKDLQEKPKITFDVLAGIYIINPDIMDNIPENCFYDMPTLITDSLNNGKNICAYEIKEYWLGIEDIINLSQANDYVNGN